MNGIHTINKNENSTVFPKYSIRPDGEYIIRDPLSPTVELTENSVLLNRNMKLTLSKYRIALQNRNVLVDFLAIFFGVASWIGINSIFLQLPLLVEVAPEGWSLPSYLVVMIQIGNIGPIAYTLMQNFMTKKIKDAYMIFVVLGIGTLSSLLTSFFYDQTAFIGGKEYSLALFILVFFLSLIGCTSSVLFMPYMGRFREGYLITYFIGEGLSGFLPSIVALVQGAGGSPECLLVNSTDGTQHYEKYTSPPLFGTMEFFFFVFGIMCCSTVAFILLDRLQICKKEYAAVKIQHGNNYEYETNSNENSIEKSDVKYLSSNEYRFLMILMAVICMFGNGIFPSIESYSCLPYSNNIYHLTVALTSIANPVACFLAVFLPHKSIKSILVLTGVLFLMAIYAITTAVLSPNPPLVDSDFGGVLVVIVWTILMGLVSYIKLCINCIMRSQAGKSLVWIGATQQAGSALGSLCIFFLINYSRVFVSYQPC